MKKDYSNVEFKENLVDTKSVSKTVKGGRIRRFSALVVVGNGEGLVGYGIGKAAGIEMLLRTMNPQVIAVDEITAREDIAALLHAANCGVALLATIHAANLAELKRKPLYRNMAAANVFLRVVEIVQEHEKRSYRVGEFR